VALGPRILNEANAFREAIRRGEFAADPASFDYAVQKIYDLEREYERTQRELVTSTGAEKS